MSQAIGILVSPEGAEWFDAYGPMTKDREKATLFASATVAHKAAMNRFGRGGIAFWNCEREHEQRAATKYAGWSNRVEAVLPSAEAHGRGIPRTVQPLVGHSGDKP